MNEYLAKLNTVNYPSQLLRIRQEAQEQNIPIIQDDSLAVVLCIIKLIKAKKLLEIGTAVGYSALCFVNDNSDLIVDTIERDPKMFIEAEKNIKVMEKEKQINVICQDALDLDCNLLKNQYDVIFIDGAKAQYQKFFSKFHHLLSENGVIITDNILFHGVVESYLNQEVELSKNVNNLVRKIADYNTFLNQQDHYKTYYLAIGDGLAVTVKKPCK